MARKSTPSDKARKQRAPRIRVPNQERALFQIEQNRFVGVIQRLSVTGGSAILSKGPFPSGTMGDFALNTVFGKVTAHIEFLHTGADGVPLAQAFRFLAMDDVSTERFAAAAEHMHQQGYSDVSPGKAAGGSETLGQLLYSVRRLAATLVASRSTAKS